MKIRLVELKHQKAALNAIIDKFPGIDLSESNYQDINSTFENPSIHGRFKNNNNIDIKMETGTGKTYVGTRMMYELHQKFGLFKFIVIVPSPAIKEGWRNFLTARYSEQHFDEHYENVKLDVNTINAGDFNTKSGRRIFPPQLNNFIEGTKLNTNQIEVLLINVDMLKSKNMSRDDYNQTLLNNYSSPFDALRATKPVVIIDEPHRFPRDKKNYQVIEKLEPQMIVRFGATFPEIKKGTAKKAIYVKDYYRNKPQFELNAVDSFNQGLVKGIDIYYPNLTPEQARNRYIIDSVKSKEIVLKKGNNRWTLGIGEKLATIDSLFEGDLTYSGAKTLSNELEVNKGMELIPGTFTTTYQEYIIKDAIDQHFEHEINNFMRDNLKVNFQPKVKTLSLFFIDSIKSYRDTDGWLKQTFERLLKIKLRKLIKEFEVKKLPREIEYLDFLKATYASLNSENQIVHAGYFGEDRGSGEEAIQAEVKDILKNKEKMLSFKDKNGNWITRRFLFSKWTLREGWDNPNVFVIAKLRTSGSENSKIQEVGRGLRLPVDETGHRLTQDEFPSRLSFLIGFDEKDFAEKLIGEINSDVDVKLSEDILTDEMINKIVEHRKQMNPHYNDEVLLEQLDERNLINRKNEFKTDVEIDGVKKSGFDWFLELYPEINASKLKADKVRNMNKKQPSLKVKLNKDNWNKLKSLWENLSKRYMLEFKKMDESELYFFIESLLNDDDLFVKQQPERVHQSLERNDEGKQVIKESVSEYNSSNEYIYMNYGKFLKQLVLKTNVPISIMHKNLLSVLKDKYNNDERFLSELSLNNIIREFNKRFEEKYSQSYEYKKLDFSATTTIYDSEMSEFKDWVDANYLGTNVENNIQTEKRFLYERPPVRYDSVTPELELLKRNYDKNVTVFGNLPKKAIQVPKYTGGTTTPDFVYMIETDEQDAKYLIVETKAENMRIGDKSIGEIQKNFFNTLDNLNIKYQLATSAQDVYNEIKKLDDSK
ncbi:type III restriction-modification system endonuclease [Staphylococcus pseudintermedius]|uniref:type III restriction-modification system endonuclease n=1 Tax=Staphylococcus pseudintermedius TaxID=283734 RepID=UPI0018E115F9|nr:type III restriction-modification system endonuclease [Staphylococcus pseudintermedius]EGQ3137686.1 type III restriction-modification system endonuclease [Staphylococcus pseudintermedius]EGQ4052519.1 type III restriction-modification system endonuclease [Staphylococcus pseudintermedius]EHS7223423.1 type III restriction-modification system endonuclease [Staphylococcus pseudintermedius]EIE3753435.1 type III restriction-modification system endonuclease [Staphylococcus pseudintermedius]EIO01086